MTATDAPVAADQQATLAAIAAHHSHLEREVTAAASGVVDAVDRLADLSVSRLRMLTLLHAEVLPHAVAEEQTLYRVGAGLPRLTALVRVMTDEHRLLEQLVDDLEHSRANSDTVAAAAAVRALFASHLSKENDVLLPALLEEGVDLAALLDGMHEVLGQGAEDGHGAAVTARDAEGAAGGCGCGGCGCGGGGPVVDDVPGVAAAPEAGDLDVRLLPHARRHETIFDRVRALAPGEAFVLANDHDPVPLRSQLALVAPDAEWRYLAQGPQLWRVQISR
ncbi:MAG: DUF2249 domain-containing protein [Actinomycetes bacterium]